MTLSLQNLILTGHVLYFTLAQRDPSPTHFSWAMILHKSPFTDSELHPLD